MTLAIGTAKGTLVLYNHVTSRKIPVYGKHGNKAITCGAWNSEGQLCLGGNDKSCTISDESGSTIQQLPLHGIPSNIAFHEADAKEGESPDAPRETMVSILLGNQTLYLWNSAEPENPIELEFQARYGEIVSYEWFGDKKVLIGFSSGYFIVVSTHMEHIGQELFQAKNHRNKLNDVCASITLNKAASCGDAKVQIHDLSDPTDIYGMIELEDDRGMLDRMDWSDDGQLLTISTQMGIVYTYLTKLPVLGASCGTRICNLTALKEMSIADPGNPDEPKMKVTIPIEPSFVAVGPYHAAAGLNSQAYFYVVSSEDGSVQSLSREPKTYMSTIDKLAMNSTYAAVLTDGRLQLHLIESDPDSDLDNDRDSILFPTADQDSGRITSFALTTSFCIYGTQTGVLLYFMLEDWKAVSTFRHVCGIKQVFPDPSGARLIFVDDKGDTLLFNPVDDSIVDVPEAPLQVKGCLWDQQGLGEACFVVYDDKVICTYMYRIDHYASPQVVKIDETKRADGISPVIMLNGMLVCVTPSGRTTDVVLPTHSDVARPDASSTHPKSCAIQNTKLGRFREAFIAAMNANDDEVWQHLYIASLESLDLNTARMVAQARGDPAAASALSSIEHIEDSSLLSGHVALVLGDNLLAEKMFLASSEPVQALQMQRDLLKWEEAMTLAKKFAPEEIPFISREYAQQLEFQGSFPQALNYFKAGIVEEAGHEKHDNLCRAGMARMLLRNGDLRAGLNLAAELNLRQIWRDCAAILQAMGQMNEAAQSYEKGDQPDKAAAMYIKMRNWGQVAALLPRMTSTKLVIKYAKAREAEGAYREAVGAYEQAGEFESVIRINLDHLSNPDEAVRMVKQTGSAEGAKLVARFFINLPGGGDPSSAIQFLVMSGAMEDAFQLAQKHSQMEVYASVIGSKGSIAQFRSIATYYENNGNMLEAGRFFFLAEQYPRSLGLLLKSSDPENQHIDLAIEVVGKAQKQDLTEQLIDYVMGETDGNPKEAIYLFKLYIAMKQFPEAARTAVIMSLEEQQHGNYRKAHSMLFQVHQTLDKEGVRIPNEMWKNLTILHSYVMVKVHIKRQDHLKAARLLVRVAENISAFPAHVVNILTSTVIECWKAGLKSCAFSYAAMLCRPEYNRKIDPKYKQKIEKIARTYRKDDSDAVEDEMVPSPFDGDAKMPAYELTCPSTSNVIPFCIVSGKAMQKADWARTGCCGFNALRSELDLLAEAPEVTCPMCSEPLDMSQVESVIDPTALLRKFNQGTAV